MATGAGRATLAERRSFADRAGVLPNAPLPLLPPPPMPTDPPDVTAADETFAATDGFALAGTWYRPPGAPERVVLVSPATGVRRRLYDGFARALARRGAAVLTWDWRGTGDSRPARLRGFPATMRAWGERDLAGAIDHARRAFPAAPLAAVGHSFGGQGIGLAPNAGALSAVVTIAAQSGWYGHWPARARWRYALLWHVAMPALSRALGYFPARRLGAGEDLPAGVALEWSRWNRSPDYLGTWEGHARLTAPVLSFSFTDDPYAPDAAVAWLHARYGGPVERRHRAPAEVGAARVGHFGFFRPGLPALWEEAADWLATRARR